VLLPFMLLALAHEAGHYLTAKFYNTRLGAPAPVLNPWTGASHCPGLDEIRAESVALAFGQQILISRAAFWGWPLGGRRTVNPPLP
jgi:hypothetical protein